MVAFGSGRHAAHKTIANSHSINSLSRFIEASNSNATMLQLGVHNITVININKRLHIILDNLEHLMFTSAAITGLQAFSIDARSDGTRIKPNLFGRAP